MTKFVGKCNSMDERYCLVVNFDGVSHKDTCINIFRKQEVLYTFYPRKMKRQDKRSFRAMLSIIGFPPTVINFIM